MRRAAKADRPQIEKFLRRHIETSMFQLSNLARYGMDGGHGRAVKFWVAETAAEITDVLTMTEAGNLLPQCPTLPLAEIRAALVGVEILTAIGPTHQIRAILPALAIDRAATTLNDDEPHFALTLSDLIVPDGPGQIVPLKDAPRDVILHWLADYDITSLGLSPSLAMARAPETYATHIASGTHRVLMEAGLPLAMTGFNAELPEIVQIGGVYSPPQLRNQGHARRAVGLHLTQAGAAGVARATLFASGPPAIRAYRALGFQQIGSWAMCLFANAEVIKGSSPPFPAQQQS